MSVLDDIAEKIQSLLSDEESMRQIKELAAMFSGGSEEKSLPASEEAVSAAIEKAEDASGGGSGINPLAIMQLMGAMSASDKNCDLLTALRPHLRREKQQRLDKALKLLKLYNIFVTLRDSGMLQDLEKLL